MTTELQQKKLLVHLKHQLTKNTGEVLQELQVIFRNRPEESNELINHTAKYNRIRADQRQDLISRDAFNLEFSKLNHALLQLIDTITEEEALAYELENAIFQRILIICLNPDQKKEMEVLFPERYYKDITYRVGKTLLSMEEVDQYQLVIFDDRETEDDYYDMYERYLAEAKPYLLYLGKRRVPDTNEKDELKAYFSNSIFSLHSRLQEMFTFLKYNQVNS